MEKYKTLQDEDLATMDDLGCNLILYNDDYHTFDYVIKALMDICRHTYEQAQQCSILVHYNGRCTVKHGTYNDLLPLHTALLDKQLTSEIEDV